MTVITVSQKSAFLAFIADLNPHGFCGGGIKSPTPIAGPNAMPVIIDKPRGKNAAIDEISLGSHRLRYGNRSPP